MALYNHYQHSLDAKGRVNFPAKLRENLGNRFIITRGLDSDRCLFAYSEKNWEALGEKIKTLPNADARRVQRFLFAHAIDVEPDKQGRIVIPQHLREYAGLEKEVMISGIGDHAEIWDKDLWDKVNGAYTPDMIADIIDKISL